LKNLGPEATKKPSGRMPRERRTIEAMIRLSCRDLHGGTSLCGDCTELLGYALKRLEKCPYQDRKPVCSACPVHCYRPDMRQQVQSVMRYAGPRMLLRHPVLALLHLLDTLRKVPDRP